jgi:hypothetical protein
MGVEFSFPGQQVFTTQNIFLIIQRMKIILRMNKDQMKLLILLVLNKEIYM